MGRWSGLCHDPALGQGIQLLGVVALPLLAYLVVRIPEIGDWAGRWLGPLFGTSK